MPSKSKTVSTAVLIISFLLVSSVCYAHGPFRKLGRGLTNTLTGWLELPKAVYETSVNHNALAGLTLGLATGAGLSIVRMGAGIYEVATFPFEVPKDYDPILNPEYVF